MELNSLINHAYAEKIKLARRTPISTQLGNNLTNRVKHTDLLTSGNLMGK